MAYKNAERANKRQREYHYEVRRKAIKLLGNRCFFCSDNTKKFVFHRKDGLPHGYGKPALFVLKSPEDWALLCYSCHKSVHWCMRRLKMFWGEIVEKFNE